MKEETLYAITIAFVTVFASYVTFFTQSYIGNRSNMAMSNEWIAEVADRNNVDEMLGRASQVRRDNPTVPIAYFIYKGNIPVQACLMTGEIKDISWEVK